MNAVYLCDEVRTPIDRDGGALAVVCTDNLAALPIKEQVRHYPATDWSRLDEVSRVDQDASSQKKGEAYAA